MSEKNESAIMAGAKRIGVLLPVILRGTFDYNVPSDMHVTEGDYVRVPFGRRSLWGVVWGAAEGTLEESRIKSIERKAVHLPPMSKTMRTFIDWVSWYTLSPQGMVLKMALLDDALEPPDPEPLYKVGETRGKLTPSRLRITSYLADGTPRTAKDISIHAKVSSAVVRDFIKAEGLVEVKTAPHQPPQTTHEPISLATELNEEQHIAAARLAGKLGKGYSVTVIDGVTGSGKTEVYFDMIARALQAGQQALVLLPEITLSVQWLSRFENRFGFKPDVWHSGVSAARKRESWRSVADGNARVVVGARSALFLPFKNLGVILVDEEHDGSYKQEDGVIYHARDMAVARARQDSVPAVLVSATPSLETEHNIFMQRYDAVHLHSRHAAAEMPTVQLIDMREEKLERQSWISQKLLGALVATLAQKKQAMLFINRRGYAPLMLCRTCGHRMVCTHCASSLTLHRSHSKLLCHHCGHIVPVPKQCPDCKAEESMTACGPGVERIEEEVRALLPEARVAVMTSDIIDTPAKGAKLIEEMIAGEIDILVGTQMIAKGHHFANLALVGVVDADMGLAGGDLRASERTYQLLHQLSGRAGRETTPGDVLLQTYMPEHPVMQALLAGDRKTFMEMEADMREECAMPPFGKLAAIVVEGASDQEASHYARDLVRAGAGNHISATTEPLLLGPAPAPLYLLRGTNPDRKRGKTPPKIPLPHNQHHWLLVQKVPASLKLKIDVDPYSFI